MMACASESPGLVSSISHTGRGVAPSMIEKAVTEGGRPPAAVCRRMGSPTGLLKPVQKARGSGDSLPGNWPMGTVAPFLGHGSGNVVPGGTPRLLSMMSLSTSMAAAWLMAGNALDVSVYSPQPDCCIAG